MTTWIVEDGSIVTGANTYILPVDITAYALARGVTLSQDNIDVNTLKTMDYLQTLVYQGVKTQIITQALSWPRMYVYIDNWYFNQNKIPQQLLNAQCELVMAFDAGYDPNAVMTSEDFVITKTMTPFSLTYDTNAPIAPILQRVNIWLSQLVLNDGIHFNVSRSYG